MNRARPAAMNNRSFYRILVSLSRDVFLSESVSTRSITIKPLQLTHIMRAPVHAGTRKRTHTHIEGRLSVVVTLRAIGSTQSHCPQRD